VWLVELAAVTDEDAVAAAISQALGIAPQPGRPAPEVLLDALAPQDMLIVLDNCEHLLRRLSVFAGSFDLDAAEAVCGFGDIEPFDVTELLDSLVDKSLVVAEPAGAAMRYRLLETIRQFAVEQLVQAGEDETAVAAAHCAYFLSVAETAAPQLTGPDQGSWLARLRMSRRNGDRAGVAYASLGLACLAADVRDWHRAAVLHGVAQAFLDKAGHSWEELEASYCRDSLDHVRAHLSQDQFERARARGMALSFDQAFDLASGQAPPA
jgi:predicted ATPase